MPFTNLHTYQNKGHTVQTPQGAECVAVRSSIALTTGNLAINTIGEVHILPAGCIPIGLTMDATDLDTGAGAAIYQFGILDAAGTAFSTAAVDGGAAWGSTIAAGIGGGGATSAAFSQPIYGQPISAVTAVGYDRKIGMKVTTAPTTPAAGTVTMTLCFTAP
jgi:hypothetical protein